MKISTKKVLFVIFVLILFFLLNCTFRNSNIISGPFNLCTNSKIKIIKYLSSLEEGSNKLEIIPGDADSFTNVYESKEYGYKVMYPDSWTLTKHYNEGYETISLSKEPAGAVLQIGLAQGSVCANMYCDYLAGTIYTPFARVILTKAYSFKTTIFKIPYKTKVEYYGFFSNMDQIEPNKLPYIKGSFIDKSSGIEVATILSTIEK